MMMDEDGQISLDFLLGISLFLIALMFIVQFIPGLFIPGTSGEGSLDYTAYRTATILVEDPGWWGNSTSSGTDWEENTDNILRLGLAADDDSSSKLTNTPNLLSKQKITQMMMVNESTLVERLGLYNNVDGTLFSYGYNISITQNDTPQSLNNTPILLGETIPYDRDVSKITRIVLVEKGVEAQFEADELTINASEVEDPILNVTGPLNGEIKVQISNLNITGVDPSFKRLMLDGVQLNEGPDYISHKLVNGTMIPLEPTGKINNSDIVIFYIEPGIFNDTRTYELEIDLKDITFTKSGPPFLDFNQYIKTFYEPAYLTVEVWN